MYRARIIGAGGVLNATLFASFVFGTAAHATEPFYFHKADVARETFVADFAECDELAGGVRVARANVYASNIYASAAGAFFAGFFESGERRRMIDNILRTCMADKGYRRVQAPKPLLHELKKLDAHARSDHLFALASASQPDGRLLPR